jgi:hypothetical protein
MILALALAAGASAPHQSTPSPQPAPRSYRLQDLNWLEAEQVLTPDTVVLIPAWRWQHRARTAPEAAKRSGAG